ncbi:protein containing DUF814 [mine drainage metagenome]|uniref:Protein containing DUF814 n=2 Tax=mine drainage metagenome TaxID=410659 RepID=T1AAP2_9ZZZZ
MEIEIDFTKNAQQNANDYYNRAKKLESKREGAKEAVSALEKKLKDEKKREDERESSKAAPIKKAEKRWYEKFHWFFTSGGKLVVGGRDAQQNETMNSKYFEDKDLFFHADIFGASVMILKDGLASGTEERSEVAQFAGCYSSAWKNMQKSVDVYALTREHVGKSTGKGSLGTGSFLLSGEREWFRNVDLSLVMFISEGLNVVPKTAFDRIKAQKKIDSLVTIEQGNIQKSDIAKAIAKKLGYADIDYIMQQLPAGTFRIGP